MEALVTSKLNKEFWKNRKVFITGHTGFKGSWLCVLLNMLGAEITGYALEPPSEPSMFKLVGIDKLMTSVIGDIRELESVKAAMKKAEPDIVIHMAAQPLVRESYRAPAETYAVNVMGTVNLLEAVRSAPSVRAVLNVTTDKVYENQEWLWGYREIDSLGGYDPYSNSKACSELVTAAFRSSFFNPDEYYKHGVSIATVRAGNVVGGGDWATDRLIPDCVLNSMQNKTIIIRSPGAVRPWQHVLDPVVFYLMLCERLYLDGIKFASAWNVAPNNESCISVGEVVSRFADSWETARYEFITNDGPHEAGLLKLDNSKAKSMLKWQPVWEIEKTLNATVDWYRAWADGQDMLKFTKEQILSFLNN